MDTPNIINLPVEIVLLIADELPRCRDVLSLMRVYLTGKVEIQDTVRRLQRMMFRMDFQRMLTYPIPRQCISPDTLLPGLCWAILQGNIQLAQLALNEYEISHPAMVDALWESTVTTRSWSQSLDTRQRPGRLMLKSTMTPVMLAVRSGNSEMVKFVLKTWRFVLDKDNGARPGAIDTVRAGIGTALGLAAGLTRLDIIQLLVEAGANICRSRNEIPREAYCPSGGSLHDSNNSFPPLAPARRCGRAYYWDGEEDEACVFAALCERGATSGISYAQQVDRMNVASYFFDHGHFLDGRYCFCKRYEECWHGTNQAPTLCTPLWHTVQDLPVRSELVPLAQFLIRRGASWAPWTAWADAPWGRGRICSPGWRPHWHMSPLEWILRGGACAACIRRQDKPDLVQLEVEQIIFTSMMDEGAERPTTPDQLQSALELVIHAHSTRAFKLQQPLRALCQARVRYLVEKGARIEDLDEHFTKALTKLARLWDKDLAILASLQVEHRGG
jgi:hypothetical protein